jgi:hypothetical protein
MCLYGCIWVYVVCAYLNVSMFLFYIVPGPSPGTKLDPKFYWAQVLN